MTNQERRLAGQPDKHLPIHDVGECDFAVALEGVNPDHVT